MLCASGAQLRDDSAISGFILDRAKIDFTLDEAAAPGEGQPASRVPERPVFPEPLARTARPRARPARRR